MLDLHFPKHILAILGILFLPAVSSRGQDFDQKVAPILAANCLECHTGKAAEGDLDLSTSDKAFLGGDSGKAIVPGNLNDSLLWERIESDEMPPKHPLGEADKQLIKDWIRNGAKWGTSPIDRFAYTTATRAGRDFWSLQPLKPIEPPDFKDKTSVQLLSQPSSASNWQPTTWTKNEIDQFISYKLLHRGLHPSPAASPRALIRRVYFDLVGLPPDPAVVKAFVDQPTQQAYLKIVNDLLASKHYGERWGRHWLDVVRFGESNGFERNGPRTNAWPYRDWVIQALNEDMPYDEFVRGQIMGDLTMGGQEGAAATGFWVAGVHNTVVGGSKRMKLLARQDEIEEVLATVGQTFVGLTINCARCHDHKYDPITQKDFYQLASAISGLGYGEKTVKSKIDEQAIQEIDGQLTELRNQLSEINAAATKAILAARQKGQFKTPEPPRPSALWDFEKNFDDSISGLKGKPIGSARLENGALILDGQSLVETETLGYDVKEKTLEAMIQLDDLSQRGGGAITIETRNGVTFDSIVFGEREPGQWMAGSNGFVRTDSFMAPVEKEAQNRPVHMTIVYKADGTIIGYRNGVPYGRAIRKSGLQHYQKNDTEFIFGLRHKPVGGNRFLKGKIFSAAFYDRALSPEEVAASAGDPTRYVPEKQIVEFLSKEKNALRSDLKTRIATLENQKSQIVGKANLKMFTLTAGRGETTRILLRGDPETPADEVTPGAVESIPGLNADFGLTANAPEAERRKKLAEWITDPSNPLFPRVIANRIWHYHFGQGIVDTPNDLGFNGGRPSHPELLDWLANYLVANQYRLKSLHRLIVTSATYQQHGFSTPTENKKGVNPADVDADNRLLWRMNPRRLEAESIRDAMLYVAGKLDTQMGGPSFQDVRSVSNNGTTYYFPMDDVQPEHLRRTVYRFNPRGGRSALLDTFDCPDPAATAPKRAVTTTPLQALSLLNNSFVLQMSEYLAERVRKQAGKEVEAQVVLAWQITVNRQPSPEELKLAIPFVQAHGLHSLARALFNINEFVAIE